MATEYPPLNKIYVFGYSANDRDFPILSATADPRVAGYQVPKDLSACPDKRYPNHVFTGAQPISGDQRVRHVWEILPSPYVPFTRYDDDLGPVQGRRRSVKNDGQVASREADKQVTYDAREGSAIVYTELEETWSIKTDEDGNSLFPIRDRDFYDASRGAVQERRQIFVPTGEEEGSLENVNGVITQTSYEPYNDFLSVKIVQTYKVDGPQLIGKATDNEGQLVTITTQRKAADGYVPTSPTATRTVEANREDAESLVERIVDTPQVFGAEVYRKTREDITPQKFKAAQEDSTSEQNIEGTASPTITLSTGEFAKSEQQINKFVKRVSTTTRDIDETVTLVERVLTNEGQVGTRTLNLQAGDQSFTPSATLVDASVEALGDGRTVKSETVVPNVFEGKSLSLEKPDVTPEKFRAAVPASSVETSVAGTVTDPITLAGNEISKSEQQVTEFVKRIRAITRDPAAEGTLTGEVFTGELGGGTATVTERYGASPTISPDYGTVAAEKEALGDGKFVTREVVLSNPPVLTGQEYDDQLDIVFPFTQQFVEPNAGVGDARTEVQPRDVHHSLKRNIDINEFRTAALNQHWAIADVVNVGLPDKLIGVDILKTVAISSGEAKAAGSTGWNAGSNSSYDVAHSVRPQIVNGYSGIVPATRFVFFLDKSSATMENVLSKLTALYGSSVVGFPALKPEPITITLNGGSISRRVEKSLAVTAIGSAEAAGAGNASGSDGFSTSLQVSVVNIPATLHGNITFNKVYGSESPTDNEWFTYKLEASGNASLPDEVSDLESVAETISSAVNIDNFDINFYPSSATATNPSSFPAGNYLVNIDSESFRYGLVRFTAVVAHIDSSYI